MLRTLVEARAVIAMTIAAGVGMWGLHTYPVQTDDVFVALVELRKPALFQMLACGYATLWFATPFFLASLLTSLLAIVVYRRAPAVRYRTLPRYPEPETREQPSLVLGETHSLTTPGRASGPAWLTIPQRGLYTGVMVVGAVGTGKTSACMYPYVDQLLRWRASDAERRIGGLVLEVKGDFCRQVRMILARAGREADYVEVGIDSGVCYNPLHTDLDPYAVAYAVATLLNNLFGKSKEPFWQQAYTDLLKFVILLRRITDGYTTLAEVYRYVLQPEQVEHDIRRLRDTLKEPPESILVPTPEYRLHCLHAPWVHWFPEGPEQMAHPYDSELENFLAFRHVPFRVDKPISKGWQDRLHQLDAVERWYRHGWSRLDTRLRSSITEGVVV